VAANNYLKVVSVGKIIRIITFNDADKSAVENAENHARAVCPPRGVIVAWREAVGLHADGYTGVVG
jgi:hypothetical protein